MEYLTYYLSLAYIGYSRILFPVFVLSLFSKFSLFKFLANTLNLVKDRLDLI